MGCNSDEALDHVFSFSIRERELERKNWEPQFERKFQQAG